MRSIVPFFLSCITLLFITNCSGVRKGEKAPADPPSGPGEERKAEPVSREKDQASPALPEPRLPDGVAPLDFERIPDVELLSVPVAEILEAVPRLGREVWYGVYVLGQKVGYMSNSWTVQNSPEGPELLQKQYFRMEMVVLGGKKTMELMSLSAYNAYGEGRLRQHFTEQKADHQVRTVTLELQPDGTHRARVVATAAGKKTNTDEYTPERPVGGLSESDLAMSLMLNRGPDAWNTPKAWRLRKFMSTEVKTSHEVNRVVEQVEVTRKGRKERFLVVETVSDNPRSRVYSLFGPDGVIETSRVGAIEMRREDKDTAMAGLGGKIDTGFEAIIPLNLQGKEQTTLGRLDLELDGPFPSSPEFLNNHRYSLRTEGGRRLLTLRVDSVDGLVRPEADKLPDDIRRYLRAEPNIEVDDPLIVELSKTASRGAKTPLEIIRAVTAWVADNVEDTLRSDVESARMVAQLKKGDCTEHSILSVALFRALGFPARQVGGVGYVQLCDASGCRRGLGYHAWTQVYAGRWIDVDPTWNQVPADVTHLLMGTTTDMEWLESLGNLKITILGKEVAK